MKFAFAERPLRAAVVALALILAAGVGCNSEKGASAPGGNGKREAPKVIASPENPQVVNGDLFEDYYGAFTIERPNRSWSMLTRKEVSSNNPAAVMGMESKAGKILVIIDSAEDITLQASKPMGTTSSIRRFGHRRIRQGVGRLDRSTLSISRPLRRSWASRSACVYLLRERNSWTLDWATRSIFSRAGNLNRMISPSWEE